MHTIFGSPVMVYVYFIRFKAAEMPSSTAEAASVPAAIAEEEEEGEEVKF